MSALLTPASDAITVAQFRSILPSFADSSIYLDENVQLWISIVSNLLDAGRWGVLVDLGQALYVAHQLTLERQAILTGQRGGVSGTSFGLMSSKSINGVSVSYNTAAIALQGAGDYNLTIYGIRFMTLVRQLGTGPLQVSPLDFFNNGGGQWLGPIPPV